MEIIIIAIIVAIAASAFYLSRKPKAEPGSASVPYKVDAPVVEVQETPAEAKKPRAKKAPAAKKTAVKKPAVIKPAARKPKTK